MRRFPRLSHICCLLTVTLLSGCLGLPRMKPDVVDFEEMLVPPPPGSSGLPSAVELAGLGEGHRPEYKIGPLDEIVILVWGRPDLGSQLPSGEGRRVSIVGADGTIGLAFLGRLTVAGKTLDEVRSMLDSRYAEVVENPQVDVELAGCNSKYVIVEGEINSPGRRNLCVQRNTLGEILSTNEQWQPSADLSRIVLARRGVMYSVDFRPNTPAVDSVRNVLLEDGDHLYVPSRAGQVVYIFGEVQAAGVYQVPPYGMTLLQLIGRARGADTIDAQQRRFFLARPRGTQVTVYEVDMGDLLRGPEVPLFEGDRVFIPPTGLAKWNRWWRQALPITQAVRVVYRTTPTESFF